MQRLVVFCCLLPSLSWAQSSASHRLESAHFNSAGRPLNGASAASLSHKVTLDALGDIVRPQLTSTSWSVGSAFVLRYRPPGEVLGLRFVDRDTLQWQPDASVGSYNLYRDLLASLSPANFGNCLQNGLTATSVDDATLPAVAQGFFYLVTADNRLGEQGTLGRGSSGSRVNNHPCP